MSKHPHILNAASNLLGIALIIVTGLHVAGGIANLWPTKWRCWRPSGSA